MQQMYVPPLSKVNKVLLLAYVGIFLIGQIGQMMSVPIGSYLALSNMGGFHPLNLFQLLVHPFVDHQLMSVIFNGLILWFIGSELELKWGRTFYLKFLGVSAYSAGVVFLLLSLVGITKIGSALYGLSGANLALLVAYAIIYSERTMIFMFIFPMKAKYFCMLLAAIEVFMAVTARSFNSAWGHIIAMAVGFGYVKYHSLKAQGLGLKNIYDNHKSHQARKKRGNLRLVKSEDEKANPEDPKYWQ